MSMEFTQIKQAAIKFPSGKIYKGKRHHECFKLVAEAGEPAPGHREQEIQGFMAENGVFFNREDALYIVEMNGQLKKPLLGSVLTSEDLW